MINALYIRAKTIKLSEENIALPLHDLGLVSESTDRREEKTKQPLTVKNKLDLTRIKKLALQRTTRN